MFDESATWNRKPAIILNYQRSAANCVVFTKHYQLCCPNLCKGVLAEIEFAVGQEEASSQEILMIMDMSISSIAESDVVPLVQIDGFLRTRLDDVAFDARRSSQTSEPPLCSVASLCVSL